MATFWVIKNNGEGLATKKRIKTKVNPKERAFSTDIREKLHQVAGASK